MKNYLLYAVALFFFVSCGDGLEVVDMKEEDGTTVRYSRKKENFAKHGLFTRFNENNQKVEEAHYQDDTLHGERRLYFETGELKIVENHQNGLFEGPYQIFHKNGQVKFEATYVNGALEGKGQSYYDDGQLKEVVLFKNNDENGPFEEYHPNGKIKTRGNYLDGDSEHGLLELFDEAGQLTKKMQCTKGICRTTWTIEDGPVSPQEG